ncbi:AAA family ATPase [candidate division TA06 bacterium DG_26]|uniref:AAA family ATPase n=1 Tax=candidate division TA06 bacterium DG_26 TaxID=1703771 RepID=A0A0S7WIC6_UNCT6|nr:MAG: AAA family ATPase [candidate division TA06 bacterium DG_26]
MKRKDDIETIEQLKEARDKILAEIEKVIVGQKRVIEELLIALLANGHCLIVGVPGLAKTLIINTLANVLSLSFNRIQFTPDLMPSDITGTDIIEEDMSTGKRGFRFVRGPIFANIVLADEINRTPPKTQAALLQAMQEYKVTVGGVTYELALPFFVLATQNPIELEGTYPLPEAQLDRFMFNTYINYPSQSEEEEIVKLTTSAYAADLQRVLNAEEIIHLQRLVRRVPVPDYVVQYAVHLARLTRPGNADTPKFISDWVSWGAGPRASQYLILGAKTRAILDARYAPTPEDVDTVAMSVLRHRIVTNFNAEADGIGTPDVIERLLGESKKEGS